MIDEEWFLINLFKKLKMKHSFVIPKEEVNKDTLTYSSTRKTVDLIENSEVFQKELIKLRSKFKINTIVKKFNHSDSLINVYDKIIELGEDFNEDCETLLSKLNLPEHWLIPLMVAVITCHIFIPPDNQDLVVVSPLELEHKTLDDALESDFSSLSNELSNIKKGNAVFIVVKKKMGITELIRNIRDIWDQLKESIESLPESNTHKVINPEMLKRIVYLKEEEGLSYSKIADILSIEHEHDIKIYDVLNEDYVKNRYHTWKKLGLKSIT